MENDKETKEPTVLDELIAASEAWEPCIQDALRRVVERGSVAEEDVVELVRLMIEEACSDDFSHEEAYRGLESTTSHSAADAQAATSLLGIKHIRGVNRLADNQEIPLKGEGLHVIYGNNGSGKSGYARIFKSACRFRGRKPPIEGDIAIPSPPKGEAEIRYRVGQNERTLHWNQPRR